MENDDLVAELDAAKTFVAECEAALAIAEARLAQMRALEVSPVQDALAIAQRRVAAAQQSIDERVWFALGSSDEAAFNHAKAAALDTYRVATSLHSAPVAAINAVWGKLTGEYHAAARSLSQINPRSHAWHAFHAHWFRRFQEVLPVLKRFAGMNIEERLRMRNATA